MDGRKIGDPVEGSGFDDDGHTGNRSDTLDASASYEERIASLLDAHGENLEAAVHRISAASCYQKAGDPSRATNLFRAALAGPLREATRTEVEALLSECLALLMASAPP